MILLAGGIIKEKHISQTKSKEIVCLEEITWEQNQNKVISTTEEASLQYLFAKF